MSQKNKNIKKEKRDLSSKKNNSLENISNEDNKNNIPSTNILVNKINEDNSSNNNKVHKSNKKSKTNRKGNEQSKNNEKEIKKKEEKKNVVIETKIVDELPKDDVLENKIQNVFYKIVFVFHNQDNFLKVKPELKIVNMIKKISKYLNLQTEKLSIKYKDNEITEKYNDITVKQFFNFPKNKSRPILYVKIKQSISSNSSSNLSADIDKYSIFYKRSYDNKVKIMNYPLITDINVGVNDDIYNIINTFLKDTNITSDFTCERKEENNDNKKNKEKSQIENNDSKPNDVNNNLNVEANINLEENKNESNIDINNNNINNINNNVNKNNIVYYIGFPSPDIAFDFNRYMNSLRLINPTFQNIKIHVLLSKKKSSKVNKGINDEQEDYSKRNYKMNFNYRYGTSLNLDEKNLKKRNIEILNIVRNNFLNNKMNGLMRGNNSYNYLSISSPYSTPYDERIKDMHENRKKWLSPKGFISSVNKYSGVHI